MSIQKTITPIDNSVYIERPLSSDNEINDILDKSKRSFISWKNTSIAVSYTHLTLPTT